MSNNDINSYRLTSMEEPTDEMLAAIMHEVAIEVKRENEIAHKLFFEEIRAMMRANEIKWNNKMYK